MYTVWIWLLLSLTSDCELVPWVVQDPQHMESILLTVPATCVRNSDSKHYVRLIRQVHLNQIEKCSVTNLREGRSKSRDTWPNAPSPACNSCSFNWLA
jgi:hypothetical protein